MNLVSRLILVYLVLGLLLTLTCKVVSIFFSAALTTTVSTTNMGELYSSLFSRNNTDTSLIIELVIRFTIDTAEFEVVVFLVMGRIFGVRKITRFRVI